MVDILAIVNVCILDWFSIPDLQEAVPGPGADGHAVLSDPETGHSVIVASQHPGSLRLHGVPDVAVEVIVAGQQEPAGPGEGDGGDAADDVVVAVQGQLLVSSDVEQATGGVIRAGGEGKSIGEKRHSIDVRVVSSEGLLAVSFPHIPQLG